LIGDRPDSALYVALKEKEAKKVGIDTHVYRCASDTPEPEIFSLINYLNKDNLIDAILVQLPLPDGFNTDGIIMAIDPAKDVDRFHPDNLAVLLTTCDHAQVVPPAIEAVLEILKSINYDLKGKMAGLLVNSEIFGRSLAKVLSCWGAECAVLKADDKDIKTKTSRCDLLITALGRMHFIKKGMVKKDAVIIDIGIVRKGKKVYGDVDFESIKNTAGYVTPVPGGVGPLTIAMLFKNTLEIYKARRCQ
jgi:methylenetetrahydrofolate dehydrogenase (NADP+) / methenyltetrahydrofolate cyclohydrolase